MVEGGGDAPAAVFFGRLTRCGLTGFGGSMGCSVATTGLGSILDVPGVMKPAGLPVTATGTVTGRKPSRVYVTAKLPSGSGALTEQGVLQPGPKEVRASAPGGVDSSWISNRGAFGGRDEQPVRQNPAPAIATSMIGKDGNGCSEKIMPTGNRHWAGAAASAGAAAGFFRLGRIGLAGAGGGPIGCNSATTGFGDSLTVSDENMPPDSLTICTGTPAGCLPAIE
jgi:hypothetical protein